MYIRIPCLRLSLPQGALAVCLSYQRNRGQNMRRLGAFIKASRCTHADVAEYLATTPEAVARWISGQEEPSTQVMRDLAVFFGVCVEDLLGTNPLATDQIPTLQPYRKLRKGILDGFWGYLGVLPPKAEKMMWYPITYTTSSKVLAGLLLVADDEWLCVPTLRNRFLMLKPSALPQIRLLNNLCEPWQRELEYGWDVSGFPLEVYQGLRQYVTGDSAYVYASSEKFRQTIEATVKGLNVSEDEIRSATRHTRVHTACGSVFEHEALDLALYGVAVSLGGGKPLRGVMTLSDMNESASRHYGSRHVCMIDAPLLYVMDGAVLDQQMDDEGEEV
jgi:transcriptional regulator with XRE-family HTH domain